MMIVRVFFASEDSKVAFLFFIFSSANRIRFNDFGDDGGRSAKSLKPRFNAFVKHVTTHTGQQVPPVDEIGGLLFVFGSSMGAYKLACFSWNHQNHIYVGILPQEVWDHQLFRYIPSEPACKMIYMDSKLTEGRTQIVIEKVREQDHLVRFHVREIFKSRQLGCMDYL